MCFSATASFTSSVIIGGLAMAANRKRTSGRDNPLVLIPVLFAIQQFIEGCVWLGWENTMCLALQPFFSALFLFFAWMVWPVLVPLAAWQVEKLPNRKKIMYYTMLMGVGLALIAFFQIILAHPYPVITNHRISYQLNALNEVGLVRIVLQSLYVLVTLLPLLYSSNKGLVVLGLTNAIALLISFLFFQEALPSVWCFFAAILSGLIVRIIPTHASHPHGENGK